MTATLVLDSQGLSAWLARDRKAMAVLDAAQRGGTDVLISANTIVEVIHAKTDIERLTWALSRIKIEPVTLRSAKIAAALLTAAGLHGHKYAIDATVAEVALRQSGAVAILTSDVDDMARLCGRRVRLIGV